MYNPFKQSESKKGGAPSISSSLSSAPKTSCLLYHATFTRKELWDPSTIDRILLDFPKGHVKDSDLFLIITESIANAVLHGQAQEMQLSVKKRASILLFSFHQTPKMLGRVAIIISLAKSGQIQECTTKLPGGLGFPILLRLVHKMTISHDYATLRLWLRAESNPDPLF